MNEASTLLRDGRARAGLSTRELAHRAGMSASTVSRIETGAIDPTFTTLQKLLAATGTQLAPRARRAIDCDESQPSTPIDRQLADLHDAWRSTTEGARPDWTRLRAFLDWLSRHPEHIPAAIKIPPRMTRSRMMNALLASIADKLADDAGLPHPTWTKARPELKRIWYSPGTPMMHARARTMSPPQFRARNLAIREDSLWRSAA